jgi:hypothetical protein
MSTRRKKDYEEAKNKLDRKIINEVKTSLEIFYDFISTQSECVNGKYVMAKDPL